jgi:large subunit ribosomal protein L24
MKLKKGDQVLIISGKDRGRKGKILRVFPREGKILVEGINLRKKHQKPKKSGEKGQIISLPTPLNISKTKLICSRCGKPTRVGFKLIEKKTENLSASQKGKIIFYLE